MEIAVITMTGARPDAFRLCAHYMERQTVKPKQWIVVDDGKTPQDVPDWALHVRPEKLWDGLSNTLVSNLKCGLEHVDADAVIIMEDDDWYAKDYISFMTSHAKGKIWGQQGSVYYNIQQGRYKQMAGHKHASLCQTGFDVSVIPTILKMPSDDPFIDLRLWRMFGMAGHLIKGYDLKCIGIKGMPGRMGTGMGHRAKLPLRGFLKDFIGNDAELYRKTAAASCFMHAA